MASSLLARYGTAIDRDSAREMLAEKLDAANQAALAAEIRVRGGSGLPGDPDDSHRDRDRHLRDPSPSL